MQSDEGATRRRVPPPPGTWNTTPESTTVELGAALSVSQPRRPVPPPPAPVPFVETERREHEGAPATTMETNRQTVGERRKLFESALSGEALGPKSTLPVSPASRVLRPPSSSTYSRPHVAQPSEAPAPPRPRRAAPTLNSALQPPQGVNNAVDLPAVSLNPSGGNEERLLPVAEAIVAQNATAVRVPVNDRAVPLPLPEETSRTAPPPPPPPARRSVSGTTGGDVVKLVLWDFDGSSTPGGLTVRAGDKVTMTTAVQSTLNGDQPLWCFVSHGRRSGLVPASYLSEVPTVDVEQARLAADRLPARPAVLDYGKESGFARDLVAVRSRDGTFGTITRPVVRFFGPSAKRERMGERVQVFVEGRVCCELRLGEGGAVLETAKGDAWDLRTLAPFALKDKSVHAVHIRFEHIVPSASPAARYAECTLFVWDWDDCVVVSDVDGTITLSDVGGHLNTTLLIKAGYSPNAYAHPGVCTLYSHIARECYPCRFIYVTARPLDLCVESRTYLRGLRQEDKTLPLGPCVTDSTTYYGSLRREVLDKSSHLFKADFLVHDLRRCFELAGRDVVERPVFMAGFGNKDTDAAAYKLAGIHPVLTFVIDARSVVTAGAGYAADLASYEDPNLLGWISDMARLFMAGKLPAPPS